MNDRGGQAPMPVRLGMPQSIPPATSTQASGPPRFHGRERERYRRAHAMIGPEAIGGDQTWRRSGISRYGATTSRRAPLYFSRAVGGRPAPLAVLNREEAYIAAAPCRSPAFERHDSLLAHPLGEQPGAIALAAVEFHVRGIHSCSSWMLAHFPRRRFPLTVAVAYAYGVLATRSVKRRGRGRIGAGHLRSRPPWMSPKNSRMPESG